ncbi:ABC transporter substrate-binding protein [Sulfitobacter mediterraneus]|uniref:ABC transporter substrate-binding protein n=1 Tax=Sulfitobacter mediterraneus TaxID=83219 RepID=UPI001932C775|nr:ABC transporter substrate-binding protein [Sulfitobacter mediterraneus]MBM1311033.1 ABC transporter substrate-binding protein [Sulfitobacter mediterraneus]MBM1314916.1 ABC transporter substrate-binding protein [Sulfitobacter mediterraneus]MBM1323276.1 ABC transporter substrate-binding protein [Sulfitobacter mediterraneus]MBM1327188.1 ABC transporter substrate-binding protein [Sulfitobacter mediterraneus]MBM1398536.1 ABC transporter substrate-binding protein [Sulfitobacter mediterraneus]
MKYLSQTALRAGAVGVAVLAAAAGMAQAEGKSVTIGLTSDPSHLYPLAGEELSSNIMYYHLYDPLVKRAGDLSFGPGLAESWENVDETTWRFNLRDGVTFHNGNAFTASDVVFTVEKARESIRPDLVANIASITAVDDTTVEITTPKPYAVLPNDLAELLILDEEYTTATGDTDMDLKPMGTGPYMLDQWIKEEKLVLKAFDGYWAGAPKIKEVTFRPITNPATRTAALLTGEVDVIQDLAVRDVDRVKKEGGFSVITRPSLLNVVLAMDMREESPTIEGKNPMTDQRVRAAIAQAIDVDAINKIVMNGLATPSDQYVPSSHIGHVDGMNFREMYPLDIDGAKALMAEAGYADGFTMTLDATNNRYVNDAQIAQALASMLAKINIDLQLNIMPKSNFWGYIRVPTENSSFIMSGWDVPSGDAGSMYGALFYSRGKKDGYGQVNRGSYSNAEMDALVDQADSTPKIEERDALLQQATKILMADVPMIPLHYEQDIYAARDGVMLEPRVDKFLWAYDMDVK